eukprot:gene5560-7682_t
MVKIELLWEKISEGPWSKRRKHQTIVWNNRILLLGGFDGESATDLNDVWSWSDSDEGSNSWNIVTLHAGWSGRDGHCAVVNNDIIYLIGGTDDPFNCKSDVWSSIDGGKNWLQLCEYAPWPERWQHASCVHNGLIFIAGGWGEHHLNDVWTSPDGRNWTLVCNSCPWKPRMFLSLISFDGAIYVIGGHDGRTQLGDVWASSDGGYTWIQVCQSAQWPPRQGHSTLVLNKCVYIMGGFGGSTRYNDLWRSTDCAHWTLVSDNCSWTARQGHACVAFNGSLYLFGGFDSSEESNQNNNSISKNFKSFNPMKQFDTKVITVSLACALESINNFKKKKSSYEEVIQVLVNVLAIVTLGLNFTGIETRSARSSTSEVLYNDYNNNEHNQNDFHNEGMPVELWNNCITDSKPPITPGNLTQNRNSKSADYSIGLELMNPNSSGKKSSNDNSSFLNDNIDSSIITPIRRQLNSFDDILSSTLTTFANQGSPFRNFVFDKRASPCNIDNINNNGNNGDYGSDSSFQYWQTINNTLLQQKTRSYSEDCALMINNIKLIDENNDSGNLSLKNYYEPETIDHHNNSKTSIKEELSSAALREYMLHTKQSLKKIQNEIRIAAENDNIDEMQSLIISRNDLALQAKENAKKLKNHINDVNKIQENHSEFLLAILDKLIRLVSVFGEDNMKIIQSFPTNDIYSSSSEWEEVLIMCSSITETAYSEVAESSILLLSENVLRFNRISSDINDWIIKDTLENRFRDTTSDVNDHHNPMRNQDILSIMLNKTSNNNKQITSTSNYISENTSIPRTLSDVERNIIELKVNREMSKSISVKSSVSDQSSSTSTVGTAPFNNHILSSNGENGGNLTSESPSKPNYYEVLAYEYQDILAEQDVIKMNVKVNIDKQLLQFEEMEIIAKNILSKALLKGIGFIRTTINQNNFDLIEMGEMLKEVTEWNEIIDILSNQQELESKCASLVIQNEEKEDHLISLEDERIDLKSKLEKATLKESVHRRASRYPQSNDNNDNKNTGLSSPGRKNNINNDAIATDIQNTKQQLQLAERAVKLARKELRQWYRENRSFVLNIAPELLHYLPDLRNPGSILGDGGFAENMKIIRRNIDEYDDIISIAQIKNDSNNVENNNTSISSSRHVLLKSSRDGNEVILKGFIMNNLEQQRGFEREISILSRLRNESIICPHAIVEGSNSTQSDPSLQVTVFIEYPYCKGGNLLQWLKNSERKPWELQSIARQILYALMYLHDNGVIHKDVKPSNVLLHEDGRLVLSDFELSIEINQSGIIDDIDTNNTVSRSGTRGFMSPEVEAGKPATFASDMYSFGILLYYMHFTHNSESTNQSVIVTPVAGLVKIPPNNDVELTNLMESLLIVNPINRPTAASALMHPYFRITFIDRMLQEGEMVEQDRKLEAMRNLIKTTRKSNKNNFDTIKVHRNNIANDVFNHFKNMPLESMKMIMKVQFIDEPGIDEGGLLTEMFRLFFEEVLNPSYGLFEGSDNNYNQKSNSSNNDNNNDSNNNNDNNNSNNNQDLSTTQIVTEVVLPSNNQNDINNKENLLKLNLIGRIIVKALYEGKRIGNRFSPSIFKFITQSNPNMRDLQMFDSLTAKSLQWTLATIGVEEFGLHFESVNAPELGIVNDHNKSKFVRMKIDNILVTSRKIQLLAIKKGFEDSLYAISEEAAPFLSLLSHTDWRVMICGDSLSINPSQIISILLFTNFSKSSQIPQWLKDILLSFSEDYIRQFLVFVTGSPSLSSSFLSSDSSVKINVRCQIRSNSLPIAHTCFFQLDIPNYPDKDTLQNKLIYAIQHANTFEIV